MLLHSTEAPCMNIPHNWMQDLSPAPLSPDAMKEFFCGLITEHAAEEVLGKVIGKAEILTNSPKRLERRFFCFHLCRLKVTLCRSPLSPKRSKEMNGHERCNCCVILHFRHEFMPLPRRSIKDRIGKHYH